MDQKTAKKIPPIMEGIRNTTEGRVMVGPGRYAMAMSAGKNLALVQPKTALGGIAKQISQQSSVALISVAATSAYVYALTQASAPNLTFTTVPPGMTSSVAELQTAYDAFLTQFALFQGEAGAWINTNPSTGTASIFSQLTSVPTTLAELNGTVTSNFTLLQNLPSTSPVYKSTLTQQEALIGAESSAITSLIQSMTTLGTQLETATTALIASTQTGVLKELLTAYATDIAALNKAISNANDKISSDNSKIIGLGFAAAAAIAVGLVGLINIWNPVGWIMMAGGAIGAYFAISEIEALKAQIALLKTEIQTDTNYATADQAAASLVSAFSTQLQGFASMNNAAQQELTALEALYSTLGADITKALTDLTANDIADAQTEWATILEAGKVLQNLTAYVWPSPVMLSSPSSFAAISSDIYSITLSGEMFSYSSSNAAWTDMSVTSLSCVGEGTTLVAIDGAPIDGTAVTPTPSVPTYFVKSYNISASSWTTISDFPAAAVAVGGSEIYAISQVTADRQVYQYSGSGTTWTALAPLPGPDAAVEVAIAGGIVFALTNNSQFVYQYNTNSTWTQVGNFTCSKIIANGTQLGMLGTDQTLYLYNTAAAATPASTDTSVAQVAQLSNGDQYVVTSNLDLYHIDNQQSPSTSTKLKSSAVSVYSSDTNAVYYADNLGDIYSLTDLSTNSWTELPACTA
jgi:hypothetical protein